MNENAPHANGAHLPPLSPEQIEKVHRATIRILEETGMWIGNDALVEMARARGLSVEGNVVRFTEAAVAEAARSASNRFLLKARNPEHDIAFAPEITAVGMGRSAPFMMTADGGRHTATPEDYLRLMKLGHSLPAIQLPSPLVNPGGIPEEELFPFMLMAFGLSEEEMRRRAGDGVAYAQSTVNSLSPLALEGGQGTLLIRMAELGVPLSLSPAPVAGTTGPCSVMGNVILNNCEILGMLVMTQWIRPGLPVFYGVFPSGSDMRSMGATYGGPDSRKMEVAAAAMARHYGLLTRSNVNNDAQLPDYQGGAESMFNLLTAFQSRVNFLPGCGHTASFSGASAEKLVLDAELVEYVRHFACPPAGADDLEEVTALIQQVGPRGNYVTAPHTFANFRTELHHPDLLPRTTFEKWEGAGKTLVEMAAEKVETLLAEYEKPPIDADLDRRLSEYCDPN